MCTIHTTSTVMAMDNVKVGFIGGGNMAYAIAKGLIGSKLIQQSMVWTSARTDAKLNTIWKELGTHTSTKNKDIVDNADIIFLCVKPHLLPGVLDEISSSVKSHQTFISVAAGVTIDFMQKKLPTGTKIVRTMPNTPCLVQSGVIVYSLGSCCSPDDGAIIKTLLSSTGLVEEVDENQIDAMSAIMGCSIAWYYMVVESMSDGAVRMGVPREQSYRLAARSMEGAAKMILETGKHPGKLKDEVTSPNGSTIAGLYELEQGGMRGTFMKAVAAATARNRELGQSK